MLKLIVCLFLVVKLVVLVSSDKYCKDKKDYANVPDPADCSKFFQCMDGKGMPGTCPKGTLFDKVIEVCLPEEDVDCDVVPPSSSTSTTESSVSTESTDEDGSTKSSTPTSPGLSTKSGSEESTESSGTPTETTKSTKPTPSVSPTTGLPPNITFPPGKPIFPGPEIPEPGVECPKDSHLSEKPIFLGSKIDCGRYYVCYLGRPVPLQCARGTHWNQRENFCDDPYFAHCQTGSESDPNPFPECPRKGKLFLPYKKNCENFIYCNEGVGSLQRCPLAYGWDFVLKTCVLRIYSRCAA